MTDVVSRLILEQSRISNAAGLNSGTTLSRQRERPEDGHSELTEVVEVERSEIFQVLPVLDENLRTVGQRLSQSEVDAKIVLDLGRR
jgi:hypothetical protein